MELDLYAHLQSPVHRWDARWKLVGLGGLAGVAAVLQQPGAIAGAVFIAVVVFLFSRLPLGFGMKRLRAPLLLVLLMAVPLVLTAGGDKLAMLGPIVLSRVGLLLSARIALKIVAVVLLFVALFGTAPLQLTLKAARSWGVPPTFITLFLFTYRYIFLYREDLHKLLTAARLRGYQLHRGIVSLRGTVGLFTTLLIRSYEQSERVAAAMRLRGFTGSYRTVGQFHTKAADVTKLLLSLVAAATCVVLEIVWKKPF
jgi:cobalt/nickel transport system permease protein